MATSAVNTIWRVDSAQSELTFKVKHLMITNVKGEFRKFEAFIESENDAFTNAKVRFSAQTDSIDTNNADRDSHLKSADFFDAAAHPHVTFDGRILKRTDGRYWLEGDLQMKGVGRPVTFDATYNGIMRDPYGNEKAGFSFSGKINRKDWGLNWNAVLETGGMMVSEEVRIEGELQFVVAR